MLTRIPPPATSQKAAYILLTSAIFHANNYATTELLTAVRGQIVDDMTLPVLIESIDLVETLVYPRFCSL